MKNNEDLARDVTAAIKWEPLMSGNGIGVTALDGVVTLTGVVDGYLKKYKAEDIAKSIAGAKAVVEHIKVKFNNGDEKSDSAIAVEILNALKADLQVPHDRIKVRVEDGRVTVEGDLAWNFQKRDVSAAIRCIEGMKVFTNNIVIKPESQDEIEQEAVLRALRRSSFLAGQDIDVYVTENNVTLNGVVSSCFQKDEAERIAWGTPGIATLKNELSIIFKD